MAAAPRPLPHPSLSSAAPVTGASGFIAGHVVRSLAQNGVRVVAAGRREPEEPLPENVTFAPLDVGDFDAFARLVNEVRPGVVYHLAASAVLQAGEIGS